jgi:hypothetical protein
MISWARASLSSMLLSAAERPLVSDRRRSVRTAGRGAAPRPRASRAASPAALCVNSVRAKAGVPPQHGLPRGEEGGGVGG